MNILNDQLDKSSRTYTTYLGALNAAINLSSSLGTSLGELTVVIAPVGTRFAPMFILSEAQVIFAVPIATQGFLAIRK